MGILIISVVLALTVSFLCSLAEASLLSVPRTVIARLETTRPATAQILSRFKSDIHRPIAVILILNTIAHTMGATIGGGVFTPRVLVPSPASCMDSRWKPRRIKSYERRTTSR
jgi:CBS domain containing-hemolysin-like protein